MHLQPKTQAFLCLMGMKLILLAGYICISVGIMPNCKNSWVQFPVLLKTRSYGTCLYSQHYKFRGRKISSSKSCLPTDYIKKRVPVVYQPGIIIFCLKIYSDSFCISHTYIRTYVFYIMWSGMCDVG